MDSLLKLLRGIVNPGELTAPTPPPSVTGNVNNMKMSYGPIHSTPVPTVQPIQESQQPTSGFRYQMGQHDYSNIGSQVMKALKGTPLESYANDFIQAGNKHGIDPRVLITIANNESSMGRKYPTDSFNPFGYLVNPTTGHGVSDVYTGLRNAGFTSLPHAIDALTARFERQPTENYKKFYQDPTISNLQTAYNANPAERDNYLKNGNALLQYFQ